MAKALTLAFVAPLITTALSPIFLGEKVGFRRWSAVIIGFIGSLIVLAFMLGDGTKGRNQYGDNPLKKSKRKNPFCN